jgi:hypothetical protein
MQRTDLLERAAFWQLGLMDPDQLRDVAYEALEADLDCLEIRLIAGDSRLTSDEARELFSCALRALGLEMPSEKEAGRIVCLSVARSILAGAIEPIWGADFISNFTHDEHPSPVFGPLVAYSCSCCNGLDEMVGLARRRNRKAECRDWILEHLRTHLTFLEEWAGVPRPSGETRPVGPGFLGWRQAPPPGRLSSGDLTDRIRAILLRVWDLSDPLICR